MPNHSAHRGGGGQRRPPLDALEHACAETLSDLATREDVWAAASARAEAAIAADEDGRGVGAALLVYATELLAAHAVELAARPQQLRRLVEQVEDVAGIPRLTLARSVLGYPELLHLPTQLAIEVVLGLVLEFTEARAVSLWTMDAAGGLRHAAHAGDFHVDARQTRLLARTLLGGAEAGSERPRDVAGVLVERRPQAPAALIARGKKAAQASRRTMLEGAAPLLSALLERDELLARGSRSDPQVVAWAERRLSRLRYDLHDGPQQDVILLAEDVRLLRSQLEVAMNGQPFRSRVLGRLDDLQARLVALDGDLRRLSAFVQSPFLQADSVPDALAKLVEEFSARSEVEPELQVEGDFGGLSDSQQITLLGLIRESLSNIREHSEAENVVISVVSRGGGVEATVSDDGRGFDPETTLVKAARDGHLGLVGMHERVHLLGGRTEINSRPGGPTVISVSLPPWNPPGRHAESRD
jgi:signal transduction histidine kinase